MSGKFTTKDVLDGIEVLTRNNRSASVCKRCGGRFYYFPQDAAEPSMCEECDPVVIEFVTQDGVLEGDITSRPAEVRDVDPPPQGLKVKRGDRVQTTVGPGVVIGAAKGAGFFKSLALVDVEGREDNLLLADDAAEALEPLPRLSARRRLL